jgi:transketolase
VGDDGLTLGIDHYGASASDKVLGAKFGSTVNAVTDSCRKWLA